MKVTPAPIVGLALATLVPALCPAVQGQPEAKRSPEGLSTLRLPVSFNAPDKGFVSLALFDQSGVLVRSLLYAEPVEKGLRTVVWDGTSDLGVPLPAGNYTPKGIFFTEPPKIDFVMKVGKSGNPPYRTPDGKGDWGANLDFPTSVVANSANIILGWGCVEDGQVTGLDQTDADGNIQMRYFSFYPWDGRSAAAIDEKNYYLGIFNGQKKTTEIAQYELGNPRGKILAQLPVTAKPRTADGRWKGFEASWIDGLAVNSDTIFASVAQDNGLFLVDRATGKVRKRVEIPAPRGIAVSGDRLLVVSGQSVLAYGLDGEPQGTLVKSGIMTVPNAIATDKAGNIYVGDSYTTALETPGGSQQVCVFAPNGKLLRKLGKAGGSPREGRFDPSGFGQIAALAIGPKGDLWVQDIATGFKRTSRWTLDGKLEQQWFGRKLQHVADVINPARPNEQLSVRAIYDDSPPGFYAYDIDIASKTWKPSWFYPLTMQDIYAPAQGVYVCDRPATPLTAGYPGATWPVFDFDDPSFVTYKNRNYMLSGGGNGEGALYIYGADQKPQPVALVGFHPVEKRDGVFHGFYNQGPNNWLTWADKDGNGKMAPEEIGFTENLPALKNQRMVISARLEANLNIRLNLSEMENGEGRIVQAILPPKEILPNGAPVYDWSLLQTTTPLETPNFAGGDGNKPIFRVVPTLPIETPGGYFAIAEPGTKTPLRLPGIDGEGWWASRNWRKKVVKWNKETGKVEWAVGRRAPGRAVPGQMYNPIMLGGVAGNAVFVADAMSVEWVWDVSGLYLGRLYNDTGAGIMDSNSVYSEQQGTYIYKDNRTGKIYSMANDVGGFIHEVTLPVRTPLTGAAVTLTAEQAAQAKPWDPDGLSPMDKPTFVAGFVERAPKVDGLLDGREWQQQFQGKVRPIMSVLLDGEAVATVQAMWDDKNLYLGYQVRDKNGPLNSGSELPYGPFVSGSYVDFSVGPNWTGPRDEVRDGDLRVILARIKAGEEFKTFQQGFWQKRAGGAHPQTITSPAAKITMDDIAEVPGLQMAYRVEDRDARSGLIRYSVEIAVPLASLGLDNPAGKTVGFDASVGVSNAAGDRRERAAHWAGLSEGVVVDRPGSIRLLPQTWGTLTFAR